MFSTTVVVIMLMMTLMHHSNAVMVCADGMHPVFSFTSGGYYVRCCESGVYGGVCDPPIPGLDFTVRCRDMGFPNLCNCGQSCVGTVHKNKTCTGSCKCSCSNTTTTTITSDTPTTVPPSPTATEEGEGGRNNSYYIIGIVLGAVMCATFLFAFLVYTKSITFITMSMSRKKMDIEEGGDVERT